MLSRSNLAIIKRNRLVYKHEIDYFHSKLKIKIEMAVQAKTKGVI